MTRFTGCRERPDDPFVGVECLVGDQHVSLHIWPQMVIVTILSVAVTMLETRGYIHVATIAALAPVISTPKQAA